MAGDWDDLFITGRPASAAAEAAPAREGRRRGFFQRMRENMREALSDPAVILVVGVNGTGKTTSIGKLAWHLRKTLGLTVVIGAADTFRAAAFEQLEDLRPFDADEFSRGAADVSLVELAAGAAPKPPAGLVLARRSPDGAVEVAAAGPVAEDAVFELGSVTKVVTGLLLADAVVRGEVALDTPLEDCLPDARPRAPITLGELGRHAAGLPKMPLAFLRRVGYFDLTNPYADSTVPELISDLAGVRPRRRRMRYSNLGTALLGQALAARAGTSYEALVHERVLEPLGIREVWAHGAPEVAQPHDRRGRLVPPWTLGAYAPAGCLRGTVRGALALSTACLAPSEAVALALTPRAGRGRLQIGLCWFCAPAAADDAMMWFHNGATHGSRAFTAFVPATGVAVAAVTNSPRSPDRAAVKALAG